MSDYDLRASGISAVVPRLTVFGVFRRGAQERTTGAVRALTRREPRAFARFAHHHAGLFRARAS